MDKEKVLIVINNNLHVKNFTTWITQQTILPFIKKINYDHYNKLEIKQTKDYIEIETEYSIYKVKNAKNISGRAERYHKLIIDFMIDIDDVYREIIPSLIDNYPESDYKYFDPYQWNEVDMNIVNYFHTVINSLKLEIKKTSSKNDFF